MAKLEKKRLKLVEKEGRGERLASEKNIIRRDQNIRGRVIENF